MVGNFLVSLVVVNKHVPRITHGLKSFSIKKEGGKQNSVGINLEKKEETCPIFSTCKIVCMRNCAMWHFQYSSEYVFELFLDICGGH